MVKEARRSFGSFLKYEKGALSGSQNCSFLYFLKSKSSDCMFGWVVFTSQQLQISDRGLFYETLATKYVWDPRTLL